MQIDSQLQNLTRIFNLESLILISNIGLLKCFIPQLKCSLLGMTITRYERGTKRIHLCFICIRWRSMSDPKIQKMKVQTLTTARAGYRRWWHHKMQKMEIKVWGRYSQYKSSFFIGCAGFRYYQNLKNGN